MHGYRVYDILTDPATGLVTGFSPTTKSAAALTAADMMPDRMVFVDTEGLTANALYDQLLETVPDVVPDRRFAYLLEGRLDFAEHPDSPHVPAPTSRIDVVRPPVFRGSLEEAAAVAVESGSCTVLHSSAAGVEIRIDDGRSKCAQLGVTVKSLDTSRKFLLTFCPTTVNQSVRRRNRKQQIKEFQTYSYRRFAATVRTLDVRLRWVFAPLAAAVWSLDRKSDTDIAGNYWDYADHHAICKMRESDVTRRRFYSDQPSQADDAWMLGDQSAGAVLDRTQRFLQLLSMLECCGLRLNDLQPIRDVLRRWRRVRSIIRSEWSHQRVFASFVYERLDRDRRAKLSDYTFAPLTGFGQAICSSAVRIPGMSKPLRIEWPSLFEVLDALSVDISDRPAAPFPCQANGLVATMCRRLSAREKARARAKARSENREPVEEVVEP